MTLVKKSIFKVLKYIHALQKNITEAINEYLRHQNEVKKFKDHRRVAIYSTIHLTVEQQKQIDDFFIKNYGEKVPHTWHRHFTAFTGRFDVQYFPELLYIPEFEHYLHTYHPDYTYVFADKNIISFLANSIKVVTPQVLCSCACGLFRNATGQLLTKTDFEQLFGNLGEAFVKPSVDTSSGTGCAVVNIVNGIDRLSGKSTSALIKELGDNFVVQKRLICHESLAHLYPHSVNTFRIITYQWKDEILHTPIILRIGQGGHHVDNAHAGGMFIAVDDDGTLHKTAFTEFNIQYHKHPDTQVVFKNYKIPPLHKLIETALHMHAFLPQPGVYNWDFTLNQSGQPVLIEANTGGGSIWLAQMAHGKGIFGDKTAEILQWLAFMKKLPPSQRKFYKPGYYTTQ